MMRLLSATAVLLAALLCTAGMLLSRTVSRHFPPEVLVSLCLV